MTKLTMRTLILAALLATPACAADVDAPVGPPPQPTPAVTQAGQDQTILADALAEVTAQYQAMLAEADSRAAEADAQYQNMLSATMSSSAEANATYRDAVVITVGLMTLTVAIVGIAIPWFRDRSLREYKGSLAKMRTDLETRLSTTEDELSTMADGTRQAINQVLMTGSNDIAATCALMATTKGAPMRDSIAYMTLMTAAINAKPKIEASVDDLNVWVLAMHSHFGRVRANVEVLAAWPRTTRTALTILNTLKEAVAAGLPLSSEASHALTELKELMGAALDRAARQDAATKSEGPPRSDDPDDKESNA